MDTIRFIIEDYFDEKFGFRFPTINIYINNRNFLSLVEEIEQKNKILLGEGSSDSHYIGHDPRYRHNLCDELLGLHSRPYSILLRCTCTFAECNCIMAKVTMTNQAVTWTEIRSPWLGGNSPSPWVSEDIALESGWIPYDYSELGPFIFEKRNYLEALDELTARSRLFNFIAAFQQGTDW